MERTTAYYADTESFERNLMGDTDKDNKARACAVDKAAMAQLFQKTPADDTIVGAMLKLPLAAAGYILSVTDCDTLPAAPADSKVAPPSPPGKG
jgi:hypothetical protein